MTLVGELSLPVFDHTDPDMRGERFHAALADLRRQGWLASGPYGYVVLDRDAVEFFMRTRAATFPGLKIAEIFGVHQGPLYEQIVRNLLNVNGANHRRLRNLVNPALSPRAVERYRPAMREYLGGLFAALDGERGCEFVGAVAKPYPSQVIAAVMGAPAEDADRLHHWSNWIQRQFDAVSMLQERDAIEREVVDFYAYAEALVDARRADPGDDLVSALVAAEEEGDRLSDVECINLVFNVLIGGVDTSQSQLAHAMRLFADHPEQWERLAAEPELAARAVEEVLRFEPITPFTARILHEPVTYREITFPEGSIVMVCAFTGNRDLEDAPDGDAWMFDITAERGSARPLTFGAGIHYCLGANLARAELQEALAFLARRMPGLTLDGEPVYESASGVYGMARLPLRWTG